MQVKDAKKERRMALILAGICLFLHLVLAPNVRLGMGFANFALVYAGVMALSVGGKTAVLVGFASGLLFDLTSTTPVGLMALLLTVFSYVLGVEERNRFGDGFISSLTSFGVGALCVMLAYHMILMMVGEVSGFYELVMVRVLPSFALTFVGFLPFAYWEVNKTGKGHGISGGSSGAHRSSSHYDVSNL